MAGNGSICCGKRGDGSRGRTSHCHHPVLRNAGGASAAITRVYATRTAAPLPSLGIWQHRRGRGCHCPGSRNVGGAATAGAPFPQHDRPAIPPPDLARLQVSANFKHPQPAGTKNRHPAMWLRAAAQGISQEPNTREVATPFGRSVKGYCAISSTNFSPASLV